MSKVYYDKNPFCPETGKPMSECPMRNPDIVCVTAAMGQCIEYTLWLATLKKEFDDAVEKLFGIGVDSKITEEQTEQVIDYLRKRYKRRSENNDTERTVDKST